MDVVAKWQTRPNGIALSADGKTLYVTDSDRHAVVAFDLDEPGAAANPRDVIKNIDGVPGGIRTDVNGRFYVGAQRPRRLLARWQTASISCSAERSSPTARSAMPISKRSTSPAASPSTSCVWA